MRRGSRHHVFHSTQFRGWGSLKAVSNVAHAGEGGIPFVFFDKGSDRQVIGRGHHNRDAQVGLGSSRKADGESSCGVYEGMPRMDKGIPHIHTQCFRLPYPASLTLVEGG